MLGIAVSRTASLPLAYVPGIHVFSIAARKTWMAGINPAMTKNRLVFKWPEGARKYWLLFQSGS
jgi:hypothetical protein